MDDDAQIPEIAPELAHARVRAGGLLLDVRDPDEHALGMPEGAIAAPRAALAADPGRWLGDADAPVMLICGSGQRSLLAARALRSQVDVDVVSVAGGLARWRAAGLPVVAGAEDEDFLERYSRHLRLPQVGLEGQRRLRAAKVLVVGAGGLGSPVAFYLAAAGVGTLVVADDDVVDRSNLQRQILHTEARIGMAKVESARIALEAINPRVAIDARAVRIDAGSVDALVAGVDVVVDGADNFPTRYLLSDACVRQARPLVHGAVHRFEGQVAVFDAGGRRGVAPCYRCLFPAPPAPEDAPNCSEAGVLGVLPGVIGLLQATEALKLILGIGEPLTGRLLQFDALAMRFRETRLRADPACAACGQAASSTPRSRGAD